MAQEDPVEDDASVESLVLRARNGDREAFARLYETYYAYVRSIVRRIILDDALSDDVVHDAFITAWTKLPDLREPASFKVWLGRVASRLAIKQMRRDGQLRPWSPGGDDDVDPVLLIADATIDIENDAIVAETHAMLRQAVLHLSEEDQEILCLFFVMRLSSKEVAAQLGCSDAAARQRRSRAYARLLAIMITFDPTIALRTREQQDKEPAR